MLYAETSLTCGVNLGILLLIIFHEFIIYPLFYHCICCARIRSLWKILMEIILQIMHITTLIAFDVISPGNIIQFGMDQLQDASTTDVTAF